MVLRVLVANAARLLGLIGNRAVGEYHAGTLAINRAYLESPANSQPVPALHAFHFGSGISPLPSQPSRAPRAKPDEARWIQSRVAPLHSALNYS